MTEERDEINVAWSMSTRINSDLFRKLVTRSKTEHCLLVRNYFRPSLIGRKHGNLRGLSSCLLLISDHPTGQHAHQVGKTRGKEGDIRNEKGLTVLLMDR